MAGHTIAPYELRRRSRNYVGLWQGKHCLAAICTKTVRGLLDAQLLLLACNSRNDSLAACKAIVSFCESKDRLNDNGICPTKAYELAKATIKKEENIQITT